MASKIPMTPEFKARLDAIIDRINIQIRKHYTDKLKNLTPDQIRAEDGNRYVKLVREDAEGGSRSVYGFIDKTNGDILKAASWRAPAKHARGNIWDENAMEATTVWGIVYLR